MAEADRIARDSLSGARAAALDAAREVEDAGQARRLSDICELLSFLCGPEAPSPRAVGPHAMTLLRHAVSALRRDVLVDTMGAGGAYAIETEEGPVVVLQGESRVLAALARAHDCVDAAVSAVGGVPEMIDDPHDWLGDGDDEMVPGDGFAETAGTAALLARDGLSLLRGSRRPEAVLLRREAAALVVTCLALRCGLSAPEGSPRVATASVAEGGVRGFERLQGSLESWRLVGGAFPENLLNGLADVGGFARDVFDEVDVHARPAAMRR